MGSLKRGRRITLEQHRDVINNVYKNLGEPVREDPLSGLIRHAIEQGYNPDKLPRLPNGFMWEFTPDTQSYQLYSIKRELVVTLAMEWIAWFSLAAIANHYRSTRR